VRYNKAPLFKRNCHVQKPAWFKNGDRRLAGTRYCLRCPSIGSEPVPVFEPCQTPNKAERGDSPKGVAAQRLAPPRNYFDAKIPENAFLASKKRPFSGRFAAAQTENAERFQRGWPEKDRFFDAAEGPDFIPPGTKIKVKSEE